MANKERELKISLINKEDAEDRLAKLDKMRSIKYLNDEVHDSLKGDYAIIKDRSDYLLTNLEELNSGLLVNRGQYDALKGEYYLINRSAANLLANKSEGQISEEQYKEMKSEYTKKQSDAFMVIASIKSDIKKSLNAAENELNIYNQEFDKIDVKFKIGEIKQDEYIRLQKNYQNKIEKSQKTVSELKKLVAAESSKDITVVIKSEGALKDISRPSSLSELSNKLPQGIPISGVLGRSKGFIAGLTERFWGLSSFYKIVTGLLSAFVIPWIWMAFWGVVTGWVLISTMSSSGMALSAVTYGIGAIGALIIWIAGMIMLFYGVRDMWHERKA